MDAFVDDLGSAVAVREVLARRGNHFSGAGGGRGARELVWTPGTVQESFPSPRTLLGHRSPDSLSREAA